MKTQIIQLEAHDDALSVRDKMGWGQATRIVLVLPKKASILTRRLDLLLIQRRSQDLGVQLALVTDHREIRFAAHQLNIPVFKNLRQAQSLNWRTGRRRTLSKRPERRSPCPDLQALREAIHPLVPAWYETKTARRAYYSITLLIFLAAAGFIMPGAEIYLTPETRTQSVTYQASASEHIAEANLSGDFPASRQSLIVEGQLTIPTTNTVMAPASTATGSVTFTNLTENRVQVSEGLIVVAPGGRDGEYIRYVVTRSGSTPAGLEKTTSLPVRALSPGVEGNLSSHKISAIEGSLGLSISVTNPSPIVGGLDREIAAPSLNDYYHLKETLIENLHKAALEDIHTLSGSNFPIPTTLALENVLLESYDPPPPEANQIIYPSENLHLFLMLEFSVQTVSSSDLQSISSKILDANLPQGFIPLADTLRLTHVGFPVSNDEKNYYRWKILAERQVETALPAEKVILAVRGNPIEKAKTNLWEVFELSSEPYVRIKPEWWPLMPISPMRIQVINDRPPLLDSGSELPPSPLQ